MVTRKDQLCKGDLPDSVRDILSRIPETDSAALWVASTDLTEILYLADSAGKIYGLPTSEMRRNPRLWLTLPDPADRTDTRKPTSTGGGGLTGQRRITRPDGSVIWVSEMLLPVVDEHGVVSCFIGYCQDITEQKNREIDLLESEKRYRALVETSTDGIAVIQDDKMVFFNELLVERTGFSREELSKTPFNQFIHPDDLPMVAGRYASRVETEASEGSLEFRVLTKDKQTIYTEINAASTQWDGKPALLCFFRDITDQKAAQAALEKSEERYRDLVENIEDLIYIMDERGRLLFANGAFLKLANLRADDIRTVHFADMITPESYRRVEKIYRRQLGGDNVGAFEIDLAATTGETSTIETRQRLVWKDGRVVEVHGIGRDITQRKRTERALIEREQELNNIFEFTGTAMLIVEEDMTISKCNHEFEQLVGRSKEEIEGIMRWTSFVHPDDLGRMVEFHKARRLGDTTVPSHYESRAVDKNGIVKHIYITIGFIPETKQTVAAVLDISDRKRSENALRESEEKLRNLFDSSKDVIFLSTITGWFYDINQAGEEFFGYNRDELLRMDTQDIYRNEDDRQTLHETIERLGFVKDWEVTFKRKDGTLVDSLITATLRTDRDGNIIGYQGLIKDISERKRLEEQLAAAKKMEAIGTLAGGMAHNFNNILVGIMGYSELLLAKKDRTDPDYKALSIIHEGTVSASKLTKELLSIARGGDYSLIRLNLNNLINRFLPLIAGTLDKSIEITAELAADLPSIKGDMSQIQQCLLNLCINARDAMPNGGKIVLETYPERVGDDFVRAHLDTRAGDYVVVSITDSGQGISDEHKPHIFEPFFSTKDQKRGTGLGLSTVWGIMKSHKGLITVYSEPRVGTTFKLYFPAIPGKPDRQPTANGDTSVRGDETILIIDDEPVVREMWGDALRERGFRVLVAEDGAQGIDIFRGNIDSIDLVILDFIMPVLGGGETFARLRELKPDVKVVVSSGYGANDMVWGTIGPNAAGFIQKPCSISDLLEKVGELVKKS